MGAFTQLTVHAYEGSGKFRYGLLKLEPEQEWDQYKLKKMLEH